MKSPGLGMLGHRGQITVTTGIRISGKMSVGMLLIAATPRKKNQGGEHVKRMWKSQRESNDAHMLSDIHRIQSHPAKSTPR
jgi:hypothetical protein